MNVRRTSGRTISTATTTINNIPSPNMAPASASPGRRLSPPFFHTLPTTEVDGLAMLHLKRGSLLPVTLRSDSNDGYAEGAVTNTRFGSFPHSTLIGLNWGSQVRASKVDTGAKGRKAKKTTHTQDEDNTANDQAEKKRKSDEMQPDSSEPPTKKLKQLHSDSAEAEPISTAKAPLEVGSGFIHILPPTPEAWTSSLDHRTQVVYTPDYSYILQRLRVRPGSTIIEAGAGSGSFTHAAARAVFSGYPDRDNISPYTKRKLGKVYSYEYHGPRVETLRQELHSHGLDSIVQLTHRDVCTDGFALQDTDTLPAVDAIFLDLPAPWLALKRLSRSNSHSPLNPNTAVLLCTFSPCIEQVMATVATLRKSGWTEIDMVEIANKRIDVRREQIGLKNEGLRGVNATAATVDEAIGRLREVENKLSDFHANKTAERDGTLAGERKVQSKAERLEQVKEDAQSRKLYKEGLLVHRTEPEVKTHTSYLVFATLPRLWREEDEKACEKLWPIGEIQGKAVEGKE